MPTEQKTGAGNRSTENQNEPNEREIKELDLENRSTEERADEESTDELAEAVDAVEDAIERVKKAGFEIAKGRVADVVRDFAKVIERQRDKIVGLDAEAALGRQYKADLIEDAIKAGIRAKGDKFKADTYRAMLAQLSIDEIKVMTDDWIAEGDAYLAGKNGNVGGRSTVENAEGPVEDDKPKRKRNPDHVHAG